VTTVTGDFTLTSDELRVVTRFVAESAREVLPVFEREHPDDPRPRAALAAAWAAQAAGDAASAPYLHPIRKAHQVGHVLRAAANAARIAEIEAGDDREAADTVIEQARARATPLLVDVLRRYPAAPVGRSRATQLMSALDAALRASR
jgi:hypothetical protein